MYLRLTPFSLLLVAGMLQALFLAAALGFHPRGNKRANHALALLFVLFAVVVSNGFFYQTNLYQDWPDLIGIPAAFQLLVGPVFLWYVRVLVSGEPGKFRRRDVFHLVPFVVYLVLELSFLFQNGFYKMALMYSWLSNQRATGEYLARFWYQLAVPVQAWVYLVLVIKTVARHEVSIRQLFSNIEDLTVGWLKNAVVAYTVGLVGVTLTVVFAVTGVQVGGMVLAAPVADTVLVYYLAWVAFVRRPHDQIQAAGPPPAKVSEPKYEKSSISDEQLDRLRVQLEIQIQAEKLYTDPELTLASLAQKLHTSRNHLSRILNQKLETTFYDYINRHRIELAAERLVAPGTTANILEVATDCGFRSKSTFNKAFKDRFGFSPSEYRRRLTPS